MGAHPAPVLHTERLILRGFVAEDFPAKHAIFQKPEVHAHLGPPLGRSDHWRRVVSGVGQWIVRGYGGWMIVRRDDGPDLLTYVEAGGLGRAGFNEYGIAVTGNNLTIEGENWSRPGVPLSIIRRLILEAPTYAEAMKAIATAPRTVSNNMIVSCAQDTGDAIDLETTPNEIFWVMPEDGLLTHANHFVSPAARAKVVDRGLLNGMDSLYRDRRVRAHLQRCGTKITIDDFKSAFEDKFGHPRAVLRTPDPESSNQISATVATIIMDAADRIMWVRQSPYRSEEYVTYKL